MFGYLSFICFEPVTISCLYLWLLSSFMSQTFTLLWLLPPIPSDRLWVDIHGKIQPHSQKWSISLRWRRGHQHLLPLWVGRLSYLIQISGSWQDLSRKISTSGEYQSGSYSVLFQEKHRLSRAISRKEDRSSIKRMKTDKRTDVSDPTQSWFYNVTKAPPDSHRGPGICVPFIREVISHDMLLTCILPLELKMQRKSLSLYRLAEETEKCPLPSTACGQKKGL